MRSRAFSVAARIALEIEDRERTEIEQDLFAAEEQVRGNIEIVGQRQVLEHRLYPRLAGIKRAFEVHLLPAEDDLSAGALLDAGDLPDKG